MFSKPDIKVPHSKIIAIQFGLISPEEVKAGSVANIINKEMYNNGKPMMGGLADPRMSPSSNGEICLTDGLDYVQCPGYFGHIPLCRPVFHSKHVQQIQKILKCVCINCSKLLIDKEDNIEVLSLQPSSRLAYIYEKCKNTSVCGSKTTNGCGFNQPSKISSEPIFKLYAHCDNLVQQDSDNIGQKTETKFDITPEHTQRILKHISDDDVNFMGFNSVFSRPENMIISNLPVMPPVARPSVNLDGNQKSEDDITHIYINILKNDALLRNDITKNTNANIIEKDTNILQYYIATLIDNNVTNMPQATLRTGRPLKALTERHKGKEGRIRANLMGKRVDFSARSVITGDPNVDVDELGVPMKVVMNITKPVIVNERNIDYLRRLISNGPSVHPGAKKVEQKNGVMRDLKYADRDNIILEYGDIVHRHMIDGDFVLFNRQPTLHRMSMMAHRVKVMTQGDTFRLNVAATKPYNADKKNNKVLYF